MCWICLRTENTVSRVKHRHGITLRLTGQNEEDEPVHDQNGPEHGNIENLKPAAEEGNGNGTGSTVPELELGQAADERPELLIPLGGQAASTAIFHLVVEHVASGVEFW